MKDPSPVPATPTIDLSNPDNRFPWEDEDGEDRHQRPWSGPPDLCRACEGMLLPENRRIADCCPCNAPRGANHGLVPKNTCTCVECDPEQTGSTRYPVVQAAPVDTRDPCCWVCTPDYHRMLLCPKCGNKRCPHASNHNLACTASNEPGQPGSIYEALAGSVAAVSAVEALLAAKAEIDMTPVDLSELETLTTVDGRGMVALHEPVFRALLRASRASMGDGPIPMFLTCPKCNVRHIDEGEFATKPHHTHSCQGCGLTWRPAVVATVGVAFLPGFKNEAQATTPPSEPLSNWAARNGVDSRDL